MFIGSNKIGQAVTSAHDGGIFSICVIKEGTVLTGGKDRRLIEWNLAYQTTGRVHEVCSSLCVALCKGGSLSKPGITKVEKLKLHHYMNPKPNPFPIPKPMPWN